MRCLPVFALILATAIPASAQKSTTWFGVELGAPTGVAVYLERPSAPDISILGAWDLDDFLFLNAHWMLGEEITIEDRASWFWGPGAFVGIRDNDKNNDGVALGASLRVGLQYGWSRLVGYAHLTPRFEVVPETDFYMGGGIGVRMRL